MSRGEIEQMAQRYAAKFGVEFVKVWRNGTHAVFDGDEGRFTVTTEKLRQIEKEAKASERSE